MKNKIYKYLKEAKLRDGEVHFEAIGGMFSNISNKLIMGENDTYNVSPGVTSGNKYPIYKTKLNDSEVDDMNKQLEMVYKKVADNADKMIMAELKKLGFKRIR